MNRSIEIQHNGATYSKQVNKGCVQGLCLGPLLWNIIIDDLLTQQIPHNVKIQGFADDVVLLGWDSNGWHLERKINRALNTIAEWSRKVQLEFNTNKSKLMMCTRKRKMLHIPNVQFIGNRLEYVEEIKLLGITIDSKLKFNSQIKLTTAKMKQLIFSLSRITIRTWGAQSEIFRELYLSVIEPACLYGAPIYSSAIETKKNVRQLRGAQRLAVIMITRAYRTTSYNASLILARLVPIDYKIMNCAQLYLAKQNIPLHTILPHLERTLKLEKKTKPEELSISVNDGQIKNEDGITIRTIRTSHM